MRGNAIIHYIRYLFNLDKPATQTTRKERELLKKYAYAALQAVEIGVFEGVNTITIAESIASDGRLFGVDPFFKGKLGVCYHELVAKHSLKRKKLLHKVNLIPKFSFEAVNIVPDNLDFIFIDGDHSYEGIEKDWADWTKKLRKNGIIALHDTSVPEHNVNVAQLGSYKFYRDVISKDNRFKHLEKADSLNILRKVD